MIRITYNWIAGQGGIYSVTATVAKYLLKPRGWRVVTTTNPRDNRDLAHREASCLSTKVDEEAHEFEPRPNMTLRQLVQVFGGDVKIAEAGWLPTESRTVSELAKEYEEYLDLGLMIDGRMGLNVILASGHVTQIGRWVV